MIPTKTTIDKKSKKIKHSSPLSNSKDIVTEVSIGNVFECNDIATTVCSSNNFDTATQLEECNEINELCTDKVANVCISDDSAENVTGNGISEIPGNIFGESRGDSDDLGSVVEGEDSGCKSGCNSDDFACGFCNSSNVNDMVTSPLRLHSGKNNVICTGTGDGEASCLVNGVASDGLLNGFSTDVSTSPITDTVYACSNIDDHTISNDDGKAVATHLIDNCNNAEDQQCLVLDTSNIPDQDTTSGEGTDATVDVSDVDNNQEDESDAWWPP